MSKKANFIPTEPRNFSWIKVNEIAGCAAPTKLSEFQWLKNQGIQHILCLSRVKLLRFKGLKYRKLKFALVGTCNRRSKFFWCEFKNYFHQGV